MSHESEQVDRQLQSLEGNIKNAVDILIRPGGAAFVVGIRDGLRSGMVDLRNAIKAEREFACPKVTCQCQVHETCNVCHPATEADLAKLHQRQDRDRRFRDQFAI